MWTKFFEIAQGGIGEQVFKTILYFLPLCACKLEIAYFCTTMPFFHQNGNIKLW
jgi:hypothetical protein